MTSYGLSEVHLNRFKINKRRGKRLTLRCVDHIPSSLSCSGCPRPWRFLLDDHPRLLCPSGWNLRCRKACGAKHSLPSQTQLSFHPNPILRLFASAREKRTWGRRTPGAAPLAWPFAPRQSPSWAPSGPPRRRSCRWLPVPDASAAVAAAAYELKTDSLFTVTASTKHLGDSETSLDEGSVSWV